MSGILSTIGAFLSTIGAKDVAIGESLSSMSGLTKNEDIQLDGCP
jgi:hypothetical protein